MNEKNEGQHVRKAYRKTASRYDRSVKKFDIFSRFGFSISDWRQQAVSALNLKPGDVVVDIGCGTGLNLPLLHRAVTAEGRVIGVDLSAAMLSEAQQLVTANGWSNVELVRADATTYEFPAQVDAVLTTYALILIPDSGRVVANACDALKLGGRLAVLDMAWPGWCPLWWRHVLFFLRSYGVTAEVIKRRSWETVQATMAERLDDFSLERYWFGFFYLASGTV